MTDHLYRENLQYFQDNAAREAYVRLHELALRAGLAVEFVPRAAARTMKLTGLVSGAQRYLFSADRGRRFFSFYIRKPATSYWPDLLRHGPFHGGAIVDEKQVRFHVCTLEQIEQLWYWLEPQVQSAALD